jgi:HEPN domain-containing protein
MQAGEWERWLAQARWDLKAARDSAAAGNFEWACFQAQQAAEKAL